ncbi:hypothetical protein PFMALIP_02678 [Plasmodium falciparum MaliPS096_E11]|uniref:Surface antigen n=1 Tax=Plasmodium falciparum MaliPS096_E11 TaxID=1036727 RepID=A0A024WQ72_PLAFA|nr:hypothetical protein PFMALIP_02678 [Plasmodium falciparum MaliPS096_E11]
MKVHYINILLFELLLKILVNTHRNPCITRCHTQTNRSLCECELYMPNYDNDPEMKGVMENFDRQTSQRLRKYDERMQSKRMQCKEQCDKEIQKIILKDKLEKLMEEELTILETKIDTDDIPTCICEKSLADKMEKGCLRCGGVLGGTLPELGLIGGTAFYTLSQWKPAAIISATKEAISEATALATKAGMEAVSLKIEGLLASFTKDLGLVDLRPIVTSSTYDKGPALLQRAKELIGDLCMNERNHTTPFYNTAIVYPSENNVGNFAQAGSSAFEKTLESETATLTKAKVGAVETTFMGNQTAIIASIIAIVVIILIMVIIYLILRYRRKKKLKKKLQYIKLLEE